MISRIAGAVGWICGLGVTFAVGVVVAVALHIDVAPSRRVIRNVVEKVLDDALQGRIRFGAIETISPRELRLADVTVDDPAGRRVLALDRVTARGPVLASLLGMAGGGTLVIDELEIGHADVVISLEAGRFGLAEAFRPKAQPPQPEEKPAPKRRGPSLRIERIRIGEAAVRGTFGEGGPGIDATLHQLAAAFNLHPDGIAIDVAPTDVTEKLLLAAETRGSVHWHLRLWPAGERDDLVMWADFDGAVGRMPIGARGVLANDHLAIGLDLPRVGQGELRQWLPSSPEMKPVAAALRIEGVPPELHVEGLVEIPGRDGAPPGRIEVAGRIKLSSRPDVEAEVALTDLDARAVDPSLPATSVGAALHVRGRFAGPESEIYGLVATRPSTVDGQALPPIEGTVALSQSGTVAALVVLEPGARTDVVASWRPDGGARFAARTVASLGAVTRLGALLGRDVPRGRAAVVASGSFVGGELDVRSEASLAGVSWKGLRVGGAELRAHLHGRPEALVVEGTVRARAAELDGRELESIDIAARGPLAAPTVHAEIHDADRRRLQARAVLEPAKKLARDIELELERGNARIEGKVKRVAAAPGGVKVDGIELFGLGDGKLVGGLRVERGDLVGQLDVKDVDLQPLSRLLGIPYDARGTVSAVIDIANGPGGRHGRVQIDVDHGGYLILDGLHARVSATIDGDVVRPTAVITMASDPVSDPVLAAADPCRGEAGTIRISDSEMNVPGALLDPKSWREATMRGRVELVAVRLRCVAEIWQQTRPTEPLPLSKIEGEVNGAAIVAWAPGHYPNVDGVLLHTTGLELEGRGRDDGPPAWSSRDVDVVVGGSFDGATGTTHVAVELDDRKGNELARVDARAALDVPVLAKGGPRALLSLYTTPLQASVELPRAPLSRWKSLPKPIGDKIGGLDGEVAVRIGMQGSVRDPSIDAEIHAWRLSLPTDDGMLKSNVDVAFGYHEQTAHLEASLAYGKARLDVNGELHGDLVTEIAGGDGGPWRGSVEATLASVDLAKLPGMHGAGVAGMVDGRFAVRDLGGEPTVSAELGAKGLRVGEVSLGDSTVAVRPDGRRVQIEAHLGTRLDVTGYADLLWERGLVPRPDPASPAGLYIVARKFPVAVVGPLLPDDVARIGGTVDGEVHVAYHEIQGQSVRIGADLRLENGVLHLPRLAPELGKVSAHIIAKPGFLVIEDIHAESGGGIIRGELKAPLDGLRPTQIVGVLRVKDDERVPMSVEGNPLGHASGELHIAALRITEDDPQLIVTAADLHIRMPSSATHDLQPLEDHPDIEISAPLGPPPPDESAAAASNKGRVTVSIAIVEAQIEAGNMAKILFHTTPGGTLQLAPGKPITGELAITGGELNLLGKIFRFDRGTVKLREEDRGNPLVNATAHWNAPDGTVVFVDYIGQLKPISREKLRFHASPPLSEQDILALLLLNEPPSEDAQRTGEGSDRAGTLTGAVAAAQLNDILGGFAPGLSTSLSSSERYVSTSLVYQLSDTVTAQATFEQARQQATPGESASAESGTGTPNQAAGNRTELTLDWRFAPKWLLRGTLGLGEGATSGLDVLFQHRY
jgi:translocation and assembly module TamB